MKTTFISALNHADSTEIGDTVVLRKVVDGVDFAVRIQVTKVKYQNNKVVIRGVDARGTKHTFVENPGDMIQFQIECASCGCGSPASHSHHGIKCCGGSMCCSKANI